MQTTITRQQMLCAAIFASADASHALSNVRVTDSLVEASDGKILIRVDRGEGSEDETHELAADALYLAPKSCAKWLKRIPKKSPDDVTIVHERSGDMADYRDGAGDWRGRAQEVAKHHG